MAKTIYPIPANTSEIDLSWMVGSAISSIKFHEPTLWAFSFGGGGAISVETLWRVLVSGQFVLSSEDHGHKFGLPAPMDCAEKALAIFSGASVKSAEIRTGTADLIIVLSENRCLEIVCTSVGYENWQLADRSGNHFIACGRGKMSRYRDDA